MLLEEAVVQKCSAKKGVLRNFTNFTGKHLFQSLSFNKVAGLRSATLLKKRLWPKACNFIKKETLAQVFSCEFYEISKSTFSYRTPLVAASVLGHVFFMVHANVKFHGYSNSTSKIWGMYIFPSSLKGNPLQNMLIKLTEVRWDCESNSINCEFTFRGWLTWY